MEVSNDEKDIDGVYRLLRLFNGHLKTKDFTQATRRFRQAERAIRKANDVMESHPDFEDVSDLVEQARNRLEVALENDRIERKNKAIDELMKRADRVIRQARLLTEDLKERMPETTDLETYDDVLSSLIEIETDGRPYDDDDRYTRHRAQRDANVNYIRDRQEVAQWQVAVSQRLDSSLSRGASLQRKLKSEDLPPNAQAETLQNLAEAFASCQRLLERAAQKRAYQPTRPLKIPRGVVPFRDVFAFCKKGAAAAQQARTRVVWKRQIRSILEQVRAFEKARTESPTVPALLAHLEGSSRVFANCVERLRLLNAQLPDEADTQQWDTPWGQLTSVGLGERCRIQRGKDSDALPRLRWSRAVQRVLDGLARARGRVDRLSQTFGSDAGQLVTQAYTDWDKQLRACADSAQTLSRIRGAQPNQSLETPWGPVLFKRLKARCGSARRTITTEKAKLTKRIAARKLEDSVKNDEKLTVASHRIPTTIETFPYGRRFTYRTKGKTAVFDFDKEGKASDFGALWNAAVSASIEELERIKKPLVSDDPRDRKSALPPYRRNLLATTSKLEELMEHAGRSATVTFETSYGTRTDGRLVAALKKELAKIDAENGKLPYRIALAQWIDRVDAAVAILEQENSNPWPSISRVGRARGSLEQCAIEVASLSKSRESEPKYTWKKRSASTLARACEAQLKSSIALRDRAREASKVEDFLATCRGDEVAIAKQHGLPQSVVRHQKGRVFVYTGTTPKEYAFDIKGQRTDVTSLGPVRKGKLD